MNYGIKTKLIIIFMLISLVPIIFLSTLGFMQGKEMIKDTFITSARGKVKQVNNAINLYFKTVKNNVNLLAQNPKIRSANETISSYINKEKSVEMTPSQNGGIEEKIYNVYKRYAKTHSDVAYIYMGTTDGGYIQWPEGSVMKHYDPRKRLYYKKAMNNKGEVVRTSPYYFSLDDTAILSTTTTVKNKNGEVIGVQALDVSLKALTNMIKDIKIGDLGYVIMTTKQGKILAHPKKPNLNFDNLSKLGVKKLNNISNLKTGSFETIIDKKPSIINVYTSPQTGWKFISVIRQSDINEKFSKLGKIALIVVLLTAIITIIGAVIISTRLSKPLVSASQFAQQVAQGNLNITSLQVNRNDEIGKLAQTLNQMKTNLKEIVISILDLVEELTSYSEELSASAEQGNATISTTKQNIEEMMSGVQQISASSQEITGLVEEASSQVETGNQNIEKTVSSIGEINQVVEETVDVIEELDDYSAEIDQIIELISDIAEQTNLLALNAAIEAARAGSGSGSSSGQGFAVVADEIRDLAEETTNATENIANLIGQIQKKSKEGLESVEQAEIKAKEGEEIAEETGVVFNRINSSIQDTSAYTQQTSASTQDLAQNSDQIMDSVSDIDNMSQEISHSAQELARMTEELQNLVEKFDV
ncbi:methyl-accepting chemotaxis protein [Halobacteroides halobius DSM 5150]|uniref:Methyl-accepting chemotaxis protein n=1 Tax=Halobacteroides halobius (strain ATCC 35273 / DSM 5150 / MD-1) TaxID=748449 RepID=L0KC00_HALHC|nr:methyl-accepting chemotaxis protein [Halobacteroides halobius]AGB41618.1 methyl-accepting chemotaxis protein [Halobacteroides halobius DSM 5150]